MKDASDLIVTVVLCLLAILGYLGFTSEQKERLERRMEYDKRVWERAREGNREAWERHCLTYALGYANELGTYYDPAIPITVYDECLRPHGTPSPSDPGR